MKLVTIGNNPAQRRPYIVYSPVVQVGDLPTDFSTYRAFLAILICSASELENTVSVIHSGIPTRVATIPEVPLPPQGDGGSGNQLRRSQRRAQSAGRNHTASRGQQAALDKQGDILEVSCFTVSLLIYSDLLSSSNPLMIHPTNKRLGPSYQWTVTSLLWHSRPCKSRSS